MSCRNGELYGFIGNMMSIGWVLQQNKIYDVKIAGRIGHDNLMSVATRNDEPILRDVFQKLVDSIQPAERQEITNRWIAVRFEQGFDYRRLWQIVGVFGPQEASGSDAGSPGAGSGSGATP